MSEVHKHYVHEACLQWSIPEHAYRISFLCPCGCSAVRTSGALFVTPEELVWSDQTQDILHLNQAKVFKPFTEAAKF